MARESDLYGTTEMQDRLLLMADCTPPDLMPRTPLPVRVCAEDGQLVLTAAFGGDAA